MKTIKSKRKILIKLDFQKDKLPVTDNKRELEYGLHATLKKAIIEDRLIIRETEIVSPLEQNFEIIIIN